MSPESGGPGPYGFPLFDVTFDGNTVTVTLDGLPLMVEGDAVDEVAADLVMGLREYANDWHDHLSTEPKHAGFAEFVAAIDATTDQKLRTWVTGEIRLARAKEDARAAERAHHEGDVEEVVRLLEAGLTLEAIAVQTGIPARWCRVLAVEGGDPILTVYAAKEVDTVADLVTAVVYTGTTADEILASGQGVAMRPDAAYRLGYLAMLADAVVTRNRGDGALRTWLKSVNTGTGNGHELLRTGRWDHWTPGVQAIAQAAHDLTAHDAENNTGENGVEGIR